jgi:hypothetical protein
MISAPGRVVSQVAKVSDLRSGKTSTTRPDSTSTTVPLAFPEGEVVDTEHPWRPFGNGRLREQAQQPSPARLQPQLPTQPLTETTTQLDRNRMLPLLQPEAGTAVTLAELGDLRDERPPWAPSAVAEEPPDP